MIETTDGENHNRTILLVEDEAIIALNQKMILERHGYRVITSTTGEHAVELAVSEPEIELVLMDINLGADIDGTEAAERILEIRELPIIFCTSHAEKEYVDRVKKITRYGYVLKNSGEFVLIESIGMAYELFQAHIRLERSIDSWRSTFDAIDDIVMVISRDHTILQINDAGCTAIGLKNDGIVGRKCFHLVHETDCPIVECPCTVAMQTGRPDRTEYTENGRVFELVAWPVRSRVSERVESFVHVVRDKTAQRSAEDRARQPEMLSGCQARARMGIWELDHATGAVSWNDDAHLMFGEDSHYVAPSLDAIIGLAHPNDKDEAQLRYEAIIDSHVDAEAFEFRIVRAGGSGESIALRQRCTHLRNGAGDVVKTIGVFEEVVGEPIHPDESLTSGTGSVML